MSMQPERPWETPEDHQRREAIRKNDTNLTGCLFMVFGLAALFLLGVLLMLIG